MHSFLSIFLAMTTTTMMTTPSSSLLWHQLCQNSNNVLSKNMNSSCQNEAGSHSTYEWDRHVQELAEEGPHAFPRLYRMQESSFVKLSQLIEPFVCVDGEM
jgi:hypothetical protein